MLNDIRPSGSSVVFLISKTNQNKSFHKKKHLLFGVSSAASRCFLFPGSATDWQKTSARRPSPVSIWTWNFGVGSLHWHRLTTNQTSPQRNFWFRGKKDLQSYIITHYLFQLRSQSGLQICGFERPGGFTRSFVFSHFTCAPGRI